MTITMVDYKQILIFLYRTLVFVTCWSFMCFLFFFKFFQVCYEYWVEFSDGNRVYFLSLDVIRLLRFIETLCLPCRRPSSNYQFHSVISLWREFFDAWNTSFFLCFLCVFHPQHPILRAFFDEKGYEGFSPLTRISRQLPKKWSGFENRHGRS